jgi:hypothetical protein
MKRIALALFAMAWFFNLRADTDILVNSDFSDGKAHWKGDAEEPSSSGDVDLGAINNGGSGNNAGIVIKLKKDAWTKIYQSFSVTSEKLYFTITYKLSPDYKQESTSYQDVSTADFGEIPGINGTWSLAERYWYMMVPGGNYVQRELEPNLRKKDQQMTLTGRLTGLTKYDDTQFILAFPPGQGSVTLYKVGLSLTDPDAEAPTAQ